MRGMFCKYCRKQLPDGANFCSSCGKQLRTAASTAEKTSAAGHSTIFNGYTSPNFSAAQKIRKTYNAGNLIYWASCLIALISLFLPYAEIEYLDLRKSQSLMESYDGIIFLTIILIAAVLNLFRLNSGCIILSLFNLILVIYECVSVAPLLKTFGHFSIGNYLLFIGSSLMIISSAAALILWIQKKRRLERPLINNAGGK